MELSVASLLGLAVVMGLLAMFVVAMIQIAGAASLTSLERLLWIAAVFLFPLLGALVWFAVGRNGGARPWIDRLASDARSFASGATRARPRS